MENIQQLHNIHRHVSRWGTPLLPTNPPMQRGIDKMSMLYHLYPSPVYYFICPPIYPTKQNETKNETKCLYVSITNLPSHRQQSATVLINHSNVKKNQASQTTPAIHITVFISSIDLNIAHCYPTISTAFKLRQASLSHSPTPPPS
jgi:hypothetical protein